MLKMTRDLYHMGQLRGSLGSSFSKSISNSGERVPEVVKRVICLDTEYCEAFCGDWGERGLVVDVDIEFMVRY